MSKSNVLKFPQKPRVTDEANALWFIAVTPCFKDTYSCEYDYERQHWGIQIKASTLEGAAAMVEQCRRTLGWDRTETVDVAAN